MGHPRSLFQTKNTIFYNKLMLLTSIVYSAGIRTLNQLNTSLSQYPIDQYWRTKYIFARGNFRPMIFFPRDLLLKLLR